MQLPPQRLGDHLQQSSHLAPYFWVSGDEELLVFEARDAVRQRAHELGYQRLVFTADRFCDWRKLEYLRDSPTLFNDNLLMEVHIPWIEKIKERAGLDFFKGFKPKPDRILLIISPRLKKTDQKRTWVKRLHQQGVYIAIPGIPGVRLDAWIKERAARLKLSLTEETIQLLRLAYEGNLLALHQELIKLQILYPTETIEVQQVRPLMQASARFSVFSLLDDALAGRAAHCLRALDYLQREKIAPELLLWGLTRELRILYRLNHARGEQQRYTWLRQMGIFPSRHALILNASKRLPLALLSQWIVRCREIDQINKGVVHGDEWLLIRGLIMALNSAQMQSYGK